MYNQLDQTLIEVHWFFSKFALYIFLVLYSLTLLVVSRLPIMIGWQILLMMLLSVYTLWILIKHILFILPSSFRALRKTSNGWLVYRKSHGWQPIQLKAEHCIVLSWLVIVQFYLGENRRNITVCLPLDVMADDNFRRLKVYLRFRG